MKEKSITVIGGGPSGMMAAISAARSGNHSVRLIEKNPFPGRKLLATGNGRCNLTNSSSPDAEETLRFFQELGLLTREEAEGRIYPYSEQASSVQEILVQAMERLGVEVICGTEVESLEKPGQVFHLKMKDQRVFDSDAVILATGGKAGPQYGSTGDGYRIAKAFGHTVIRLMPSLVQMVSEEYFFKGLKGVRTKGQVTLLRGNDPIDTESGEIQFTEDGLSGICIFNLSKRYDRGDLVKMDLFPDYSEAALTELLSGCTGSLGDRTLSEFMNGMIHKKLIPVILSELSLTRERTVDSLRMEEIQRTARFLKGWIIRISGTKGWKEAQVTAGGVDLAEINRNTMESKLVPGLYFAGELLNVDEKCGGYNLQWAWSSGMAAGKAAAQIIEEKHA